MANRLEFPQRFWKRVAIGAADDCWLWQGQLLTSSSFKIRKGIRTEVSRQQYGLCWRTENGKARLRYAHRISWELTNGPIPLGFNVLHRCDVPNCVNPNHLFIGTLKENMKDCWQKNRNYFQQVGNPAKKLSDEEVLEIRTERKAGKSLAELANKYKVAQSMISRIANGLRRGSV